MWHPPAEDYSMKPIRCAACALVLGFLAPAWAVNKCTDADGKVSFQDGPCLGQGEKIEVKPAMQGATPVPPGPSTAKEGAFGPTWQRKHYLQNQGVPQGRMQARCGAAPWHKAPSSRRNARLQRARTKPRVRPEPRSCATSSKRSKPNSASCSRPRCGR